MKAKAAVAILLLALFAFSAIAKVQIKPVRATSSHTLSLPDAELTLTEFGKRWGPGTLTGKTDVSGSGVQFDFTGLSPSSGTGVGDNYPLNPLAGGAGASYSDFTAYTRYSMNVTNAGSDPIKVCLYMNTGFTPPGEADTYWESETVTLDAGEDAIVTLDFSSCYKIWNAEDDPVPEWQHPDGTGGWPIRRLDQVSNIGFQVLSGGGGGGGSIILSELTAPLLYIDPAHILKGPSDVDSFFDVYVTLEDFANFAGFDIKLTWDSNLLIRTAVDYDTALTALWGSGKYFIANSTQGAGYYSLAAAAIGVSASNTGSADLFKLTFQVKEGCNFQLSTPIHFDMVKLSDNATPIPNPIIATVADGMYYISGETPELTFTLSEPDAHPWEECKYFQVEVRVSDIHECSPLEDYDVTIVFDTVYGVSPEFGMAVYTDISWGIFGAGTVEYTHATPTSTIRVYGAGTPQYGDNLLLFTLTFHIEYDASPEHVWKYLTNEHRDFGIRMTTGTLSFDLGTLDDLVFPSELTITVHFIRGDVNSDGVVGLNDLAAMGYNYGLTGTSIYDLTGDLIVDIYDVVALATNYDYGNP